MKEATTLNIIFVDLGRIIPTSSQKFKIEFQKTIITTTYFHKYLTLFGKWHSQTSLDCQDQTRID